MASESYPNIGHNSGEVNNLEHERLTHAQGSDGLIGTPADQSLVYADGTGTRLLKIRADRLALVRGSQWYSGASDINMASLAANGSGNPRLDLVVLRLDRSDYTVTETVITGTPGASPVAPSPVQQTGSIGTWDLPVATVRVENNATAITSDKVTDIAWYIQDDGRILCRSAARPSHQANRVIFESDTGRMWVSDGTTWLRAVEDAGPTALSTASGFTTTQNTLRRRNGFVFCALTIRRDSNINADTTVTGATVPSGYRPLEEIQTVGIGPTGQQVAAIVFQTGGGVTISPGAVAVLANRSIIVSSVTWPVA